MQKFVESFLLPAVLYLVWGSDLGLAFMFGWLVSGYAPVFVEIFIIIEQKPVQLPFLTRSHVVGCYCCSLLLPQLNFTH